MYALRRVAFRAAIAAAKPSPSLVVPKTRTFVSLNQSKLRHARQWTASSVQKRFASADAPATENAAGEAVAERTVSEVESAEPAQVVEEAIAETASTEAPEEVAAASESVESAPAVEEVLEATTSSSTPMETGPETSASAEAIASAAATGAAAGAAAFGAQPSATARNAIPENTMLYVGNIFFEVNEHSLQEYFARFGPIRNTRIVYDARGLNRGFGYVDFENVEDATRAVDATNQQVFQGRRLAVQFHRPREPVNRRNVNANNPPTKTLFIGNMSFELSDKDLSDLFREVRNVIDVRIAIDRRTGQPRGFAHADFIDVVSATKAMEYLRGKTLYGRELRVDYSLSTPRGQERGPRR